MLFLTKEKKRYLLKSCFIGVASRQGEDCISIVRSNFFVSKVVPGKDIPQEEVT